VEVEGYCQCHDGRRDGVSHSRGGGALESKGVRRKDPYGARRIWRSAATAKEGDGGKQGKVTGEEKKERCRDQKKRDRTDTLSGREPV